jgi:hypothetical protein
LLGLAERGSEDAAEEVSQRVIEIVARSLEGCEKKLE